jgi:hypothetical protein
MGANSGWVSAVEALKYGFVWSRFRELYDSSDVGGAVCLNGTGFSQAYEGVLFTVWAYRQGGGNPVISPTINGADFSGVTLLGTRIAEFGFILSHQRLSAFIPRPSLCHLIQIPPATPSAHTPRQIVLPNRPRRPLRIIRHR